MRDRLLARGGIRSPPASVLSAVVAPCVSVEWVPGNPKRARKCRYPEPLLRFVQRRPRANLDVGDDNPLSFSPAATGQHLAGCVRDLGLAEEVGFPGQPGERCDARERPCSGGVNDGTADQPSESGIGLFHLPSDGRTSRRRRRADNPQTSSTAGQTHHPVY